MPRVAKGWDREALQRKTPHGGWLPPAGEGLPALMQARMQAQGVGAGSDCPAADLKSSGGSGGGAGCVLPGAGGGVQGLGPTVFNALALFSFLVCPAGG